jgi:hypothetical protein
LLVGRRPGGEVLGRVNLNSNNYVGGALTFPL